MTTGIAKEGSVPKRITDRKFIRTRDTNYLDRIAGSLNYPEWEFDDLEIISEILKDAGYRFDF